MSLFTTKEIAEAVGLNRRTVKTKALKQGWKFVLKKGMGGQIPHYAIEDLPPEIAQAVAKHFKVKVEPTTNVEISGAASGKFLAKSEQLSYEIKQQNRQQSIKKFAAVTGVARKRALAKEAIVNLIKDYQALRQLPKIKAIDEFCHLYNTRHSSINPKHFQFDSISRPSVIRWQKALNTKGIMALVDNYGKNKGKGIIDSNDEMKSYCLALIGEYPHIKGAQLQESLLARFNGKVKAVPSAATCRHWLKKWKEENAALYMSMFDPSGWQNKYMSAFGNKSAKVDRINQIWEFDSTPTDVMLNEGRYSIIGVLDVFTRRVKLVLKATSNAMGIACLVREALLDWGVPEIARTDNGADYLAHHIKGIWDAFDIENEITNPYSGWEKPYIERFFKTFAHGVVELLPGYIGHNVSDREKISARNTFAKRLIERRKKGEKREGINVELSAERFQRIMDQWVNDYYHHRKHSNLDCSPFEQFTSHRQEIKTITDERVLDVLLAPVPGKGSRTVGKEGISVEGGMYIHAELGAHIGERVHCRYNPQNVGKIYVFHGLSHEFICEAINTDIADHEITMEAALEAKKLQRANLAAQRKEFKRQAKAHDVSDAAQKFLDYKSEQNGALTNFPKSSTDIQNPAVLAAQDAAKDHEKPAWSGEEISIFEQRRKELAILESSNNADPIYKDDHHKARCLTIQNNDASITPVQKAWLHKYRNANAQAAKMLDKLISSKTQNQK